MIVITVIVITEFDCYAILTFLCHRIPMLQRKPTQINLRTTVVKFWVMVKVKGLQNKVVNESIWNCFLTISFPNGEIKNDHLECKNE